MSNQQLKFCFLTAIFPAVLFVFPSCNDAPQLERKMKTEVTIEGEAFLINGAPTYRGVTWTTSYGVEYQIDGLLMNSRMVQGIFDEIRGGPMVVHERISRR